METPGLLPALESIRRGLERHIEALDMLSEAVVALRLQHAIDTLDDRIATLIANQMANGSSQPFSI